MNTRISIINFKIILDLFIIIFFIAVLYGCKEEPTPSLYDIVGPSAPAPVISTVDPDSFALAGVTKLTINGGGFSSDLTGNIVYFNNIKAAILTASSTRLVVIVPNIVSDTVLIKVASKQSESFSNTFNYKIKPAVSEIYPFQSFESPYAVTVDKAENIYVSLTSTNVGVGIKKINPDAQLFNFAPKGGETFFSSMKMGPDNTIYAARRVKAVFQIQEGVASKTFVTYANGIGSINDLDFDQNKNIWAGGSGNNSIYRITLGKDVKAFSFNEDVIAIRIFENSVFIASSDGVKLTIWKYPIISSDSLGNAEEYFNFSDKYPLGSITAITFSKDGDMYIGTNLPEAVIILHPDKTTEPLYPGVLTAAPVYSLEWGNGAYLYYTRQSAVVQGKDLLQTTLKINTQKEGALYYGRE